MTRIALGDEQVGPPRIYRCRLKYVWIGSLDSKLPINFCVCIFGKSLEEREREEAEGQKRWSCKGHAETQAFFRTPGPTPCPLCMAVLGVQEEVGHMGYMCAHVCSMCHVLSLVSVLLTSVCF